MKATGLRDEAVYEVRRTTAIASAGSKPAGACIPADKPEVAVLADLWCGEMGQTIRYLKTRGA